MHNSTCKIVSNCFTMLNDNCNVSLKIIAKSYKIVLVVSMRNMDIHGIIAYKHS